VDLVHHTWTTEGTDPRWTGPWPAERGSPELDLAAALGHSGSPTVAQQQEGCTGNPSRASTGHGRQHGDQAMAVKR
jgi:hypothetical protein